MAITRDNENNNNQFEIQYKGLKYDIKDFLYKHPGGTNYLKTYQDKDITKRMVEEYHSKSAFYMLREYRTGGRDNEKEGQVEDLENLVDWNKPMVAQITKLGPRYMEWINAPVDRPLILFGNKYVEMLTVTPWYVIPIVWIPAILYFIYTGSKNFVTPNSSFLSAMIPTVSTLVLGVILWSLIEYMLHRYVFHLSVPENSKILIYIHFLLHGLHHKVPFDHLRLVFPPFPAAMIGTAIYALVIDNIFPESMKILITAGGLLGYLMYDMIHFYLHNGNPSEGNYFYEMKRFHNHHHFTDPQNGFGLSSKEWDKVFGTTINMRKLKKAINWDKL